MSSTQDSPSQPAIPEGVCRPQEAIDRLEGLVEIYAQTVRGFLDDKAGLIGKLRVAIDAGDAAGAHFAAHSLKGLAAMCGAVSVAEVAAAIDRDSRIADQTTLAKNFQRLEREFAAAREQLAPYCSAPR